MHLWPSKTIRESWKLAHVNNVERIVSEKRAARRALEQKLLDSDEQDDAPTLASVSTLHCLCRDIFFTLTCCLCCGVCMDELEFYSIY